MIEHASAAQRVLDSVKLQVLVDHDVRMPVDLRLVHVFGREQGREPQGSDEHQRERTERLHVPNAM